MATSKKKKTIKKKAAKTVAKAKKAVAKKAPVKKVAKKAKKTAKSLPKKAKSTAKKVVDTVVAKIKETIAPKKKVSGPAKKASANEFTDLVTPLDDRILILVEGEGDRTVGGLYIPGTFAERPTRGRVVAVGRGARNKKGQLRPLDVVVGDAVLFAESAGTKLTLSGHDLLLMRESDLLGVVG